MSDSCNAAPDFGERFPGLPVVESDEEEAGEGADEGHQQRHHGNAAGRAQVGDAAVKQRTKKW